MSDADCPCWPIMDRADLPRSLRASPSRDVAHHGNHRQNPDADCGADRDNGQSVHAAVLATAPRVAHSFDDKAWPRGFNRPKVAIHCRYSINLYAEIMSK